MAILLEKDYDSQILEKHVTIHILLPQKKTESISTLYFLHGALENAQVILKNSNLCDLVDHYNIAVVLPTLGNGFYVNKHHQFIINELIPYTRQNYPLSDSREHTFIGGYSMGGFGALYNGFKRYDLFSKIVGISSALEVGYGTIFIRNCGGEIEPWLQIKKSYLNETYDLKTVVRKYPKQSVYLSCGKDDLLYDMNHHFSSYLYEKEIDIEFFEREGNHEWNFWKEELNQVFQWLGE